MRRRRGRGGLVGDDVGDDVITITVVRPCAFGGAPLLMRFWWCALAHAPLPMRPCPCAFAYAILVVRFCPCAFGGAPLPMRPCPCALAHAPLPMRLWWCALGGAPLPLPAPLTTLSFSKRSSCSEGGTTREFEEWYTQNGSNAI